MSWCGMGCAACRRGIAAGSRGSKSMPGARRRAAQRFWLSAVVAGALIAVLAEVKAQLASGEDVGVLAAHQTLGEAMRGGDRSAARRLLSLQFSYVDENGKLYERKAFLDDLKTIAATPATDVTVKIYGGVAMVMGKRKSAPDVDAFFLDIWAKQKSNWRALSMQDVVLAAPDTPPASNPETSPDVKSTECKNPCQTIPYRV